VIEREGRSDPYTQVHVTMNNRWMKHTVFLDIESIEDKKNDGITKEWDIISRFQL
jgi:hypothetical protein